MSKKPAVADGTPESAARVLRRQQRVRRWKLVERSFTLAGLLVVVFLGWSTIRGMQRLFSQSPTPSVVSGQSPVHSDFQDVPVSIADLTSGGYWQMADWQWNVGVAIVSESDVDRRLDNLTHCSLPENLSAEESAALGRLVEALQYLPVERSTHGAMNEYRMEDAGSRLRVVTSGEGDQEMLVSLGAAMRDPGSARWTAFELRSRPKRQTATAPNILPFPDATRRLCARSDADGLILFEIVETAVDVTTLIASWEGLGWNISPFPSNHGPGKGFLCAKQNQLVHIWNIPGNLDDRYQVALMRVPSTNN
jgi:hypothetical protein